MEEENRFYALSSIPAIVVSTILAVCYGFDHLTQLPSGTPIMWDLLWNFIISSVRNPDFKEREIRDFACQEICWSHSNTYCLHVASDICLSFFILFFGTINIRKIRSPVDALNVATDSYGWFS
jgi:hypothetical protein